LSYRQPWQHARATKGEHMALSKLDHLTHSNLSRPGFTTTQRSDPPDVSESLCIPWHSQSWWGLLLCIVYPLAALLPLAIFVALNPHTERPRFVELGADCALVGFTLLVLQFVLAARLAWIESPFGLDVLMRFHRTMAVVAIVLLCCHPLLVAAGSSWGILTRWRVHWYFWVGRSTLLLLLVHVLSSLARPMLRLPYEMWRRWHNIAALAILVSGFVHSLAIGGDPANTAGHIVWSGLLAIALFAWLYSRILRPMLMRHGWVWRGSGGAHLFHVAAVQSEAPRVWTISLQPIHRVFNYLPGQFQFIRFMSRSIDGTEHPFTIASTPTRRGCISLTIKESGDFTRGIGQLHAGDRAIIYGPFGRFSHVFHPDEHDLVFVAGGVGITPHISMLRHMMDVRDAARRVLLVYASRSRADILFADELRTIEASGHPRLKVVHLLSEPPADWHGETGRLDANRLLHLSEGPAGKAFYLCCPPPMTASLIRGLRRRNVSAARIHTDYFSI
jgi:predicted ferric reductase